MPPETVRTAHNCKEGTTTKTGMKLKLNSIETEFTISAQWQWEIDKTTTEAKAKTQKTATNCVKLRQIIKRGFVESDADNGKRVVEAQRCKDVENYWGNSKIFGAFFSGKRLLAAYNYLVFSF